MCEPISSLNTSEVPDSRFWSRCNPVIRLLDPTIHTLAYLQAKSPLLLSAMSQVAAQCLPVSSHSIALCSKLDDHIEFLLKDLCTHGYQSLEICQGLVLYAAWLRGTKQQQ
jgi:hypothetical protein